MTRGPARIAAPARALCVAAGLFFLASTATATACQLCLDAARRQVTVGQQIDVASDVVLALVEGDGKGYRVVEVVKGDAIVGSMVDARSQNQDRPTSAGRIRLLVRDELTLEWSSLGAIGTEFAPWLKQLVEGYAADGVRSQQSWPRTLRTSSDLTAGGWRDRMELVLPYLEDPDPLVAEIAWGELVRAPYTSRTVLRSSIDAATVSDWIDDPNLTARRAAYIVLLGLVGGASDAAHIEEQIDAMRATHDTTDLPSLLSADLELRGPDRVAWIEQSFFADRNRTMPEIEAALLALRVLGDADGTIPRERVVEAYGHFITHRPAMAGFVVQQLADWDRLEFVDEYARLLQTGVITDPASQLLVISYLQSAADLGAGN